ncbi:MAG: DNA/RNA nuclease SfsA [Desulfobacula sp.]|uniref:DNA/RNA nuclease SfsA n=1 Tax=Desulfobacula sp. TaxID=2593537 RepID=UPI0025C36363|nr:DNA/RNA nuclease SfsA [Desulfobacula sp.]MCD4721029.1 DNA/RNA nuclease SfsA [Desulfobacula sp.]
MKYKGFQLPPLITGRLIKRYKRFLADVELKTGEKVTAHCPNSGSMKGCAIPGSQVWLSESDNPRRKYKYTWELVKVPQTMIGINTLVPNKLVKQSIENDLIKELSGYEHVRAEVKTSSHTRLDLLLENEVKEKCYVEIKNCTLVEEGMAMFPDAVTTRGQKHLDELEHLVSLGHRGVIFFLIQRMDAKAFKPAAMIDKVYAEKLKKVVKNGVEVIIRDTIINTQVIRIRNAVPVYLD